MHPLYVIILKLVTATKECKQIYFATFKTTWENFGPTNEWGHKEGGSRALGAISRHMVDPQLNTNLVPAACEMQSELGLLRDHSCPEQLYNL